MAGSTGKSEFIQSTFAAPWLLRTGVAAAGAVAAPLGAWVAERIYLTPPRRRSRPEELQVLGRAAPFQAPFQDGALQCWRLGEGPTVLLAHGWGGNAAQLAPLASAVVATGCSAVLFDGPAHGSSSGRTASLPDFGAAIAAVAERAGARAVIAHSLGATGAAVALQGGLRLDAAVLIGAPRNPEAVGLVQFASAYRLGARLERATRNRLERRLGTYLTGFDLPALAGQLSTPLLAVHDHQDAEVPFSDGAAIASAWPGARLMATRGLGHRRILSDPGVLEQVAGFVSGRVGSRTSPEGPGEPGAAQKAEEGGGPR